MLAVDGLGGLIVLGVWLYCCVDVLLTPDGEQRNLPKLAWVFIVILLFDLGAILWLVAGKPWGQRPGRGQRTTGAASKYPEYERPGRYVPSNPDDDEVFLAGLRQRAEEQRRRAREKGKPTDGDKPAADPGETPEP